MTKEEKLEWRKLKEEARRKELELRSDRKSWKEYKHQRKYLKFRDSVTPEQAQIIKELGADKLKEIANKKKKRFPFLYALAALPLLGVILIPVGLAMGTGLGLALAMSCGVVLPMCSCGTMLAALYNDGSKERLMAEYYEKEILPNIKSNENVVEKTKEQIAETSVELNKEAQKEATKQEKSLLRKLRKSNRIKKSTNAEKVEKPQEKEIDN